MGGAFGIVIVTNESVDCFGGHSFILITFVSQSMDTVGISFHLFPHCFKALGLLPRHFIPEYFTLFDTVTNCIFIVSVRAV